MMRALQSSIDVTFLEWMDQASLYTHLRAAHMYIGCTDFETLCVSMAEAMLFGCVPVVYHKGGHTALINHFVNGFLCESESKYVEYIDFLIRNPAHMSRMAEHARKSIAESLNVEKNSALFLSFLKSITTFYDTGPRRI